MNQQDAIWQINYLTSEMSEQYHRASVKLGISDSVSIVLYTLFTEGNGCLLGDVVKKSGVSKQTVNSALRRLEAEGALFLEQADGRAKRIRITPKGEAMLAQTAAKLYEAECRAFAAWSDDEVQTYLRLMQKHYDSLAAEFANIEVAP